MSATVIPFPDTRIDGLRISVAGEVADFATRRVAEVILDRGLDLDDEVKIALLLACSVIEAEMAQGGAA